jgi:hypothetical protein
MNILLGPNNSGKSTIIKVLYLLQQVTLFGLDARIGQTEAHGNIVIDDIDDGYYMSHFKKSGPIQSGNATIRFHNSIQDPRLGFTLSLYKDPYNPVPFTSFPPREPENFIYPYFSKRKVPAYNRVVDVTQTRWVADDLGPLIAKIDRLVEKYFPRHEEFEQACRDILGFPISTFSAEGGKQAGLIIDEFNNIPLEAMGEGVPNLLGLIVNLCMAKNKLFLIEEIENDIHPQALKSLLRLIVKKSEDNQFVISTHSNIVARYLGSLPDSKIHSIAATREGGIPTSIVKEVANTSEERRAILEELGYELIDSDIWAGWLFLEESTAESIIVKYLIPWFTPSLSTKLRTISTGGTSKVEDKFEDFYNLFLFTHLTPLYKNKVWVVLDGDSTGLAIINKLKGRYKSCNPEHFRTFTQHNFEAYYPSVFHDQVKHVLAMAHGKEKQAQKTELLEGVMQWISDNEDLAREEFAHSASEVITILKEIEKRV